MKKLAKKLFQNCDFSTKQNIFFRAFSCFDVAWLDVGTAVVAIHAVPGHLWFGSLPPWAVVHGQKMAAFVFKLSQVVKS